MLRYKQRFDCLCHVYRYSYGEPIPYRFSNDAYVARLLVPLRNVADHIHNISYYHEPAKKFTGKIDQTIAVPRFTSGTIYQPPIYG